MRETNSMLLVIPAVFSLVACASTPGAQPHDMSVTGHETASGDHAQMAEAHAAQYDAGASVGVERCSREGLTSGACWTSLRNPTGHHLEEAERHRKMAADHRAASQALRDAEGKACVGIADIDRDMSPFEHREEIVSVEPSNATGSGKFPSTQTKGAVVTFRATPGMTAQWLQRVVDCHLARNAALGHVVPEMPSCPLVPNGASAKVSATDSGFAVKIESDDSVTAQEILRRAQLLTKP